MTWLADDKNLTTFLKPQTMALLCFFLNISSISGVESAWKVVELYEMSKVTLLLRKKFQKLTICFSQSNDIPKTKFYITCTIIVIHLSKKVFWNSLAALKVSKANQKLLTTYW